MRFFFFFSFCVISLSCILVEYSLAINDTDLIQCTSHCSQITVSFAQPLVFPPQCQETHYDYALACGIEYRINYDTEDITIDFQATNDTGSLEDQKPSEFLVQTMLVGLSQNVTQPNTITRKYGCNTNNDCARQFYLNTINYLVNEGPSQLELIRSKLQNDSLIVGEESKRRCIDSVRPSSRPSIKCPTGLCFAELKRYNLNDQQISKQQRCQQENRPFLFSEIEHHTPPSSYKERDFLEYQCNKNVCNRDDFIGKIKSLISEYTNGTSKIQIENPPSGKLANLSIKQTISSSLLVLLFFLFI